MTSPESSAVARLRSLPRSERRDALYEIVLAEFRASLLMTEDDDLPVEASFFDLGMTSLLLSDLKLRLEAQLGCEISANTLFNRPTVVALVEHVTDEVLPELFGGPADREPDRQPARPATSAETDLVDDLLAGLV